MKFRIDQEKRSERHRLTSSRTDRRIETTAAFCDEHYKRLEHCARVQRRVTSNLTLN